MRTVDGPIKAVTFWLPGDDGDVVVALMKTDGEWDGARESEVSNAVMTARGLRKRAETSDESFATVVPALLGSLLAAVGVAALLMRVLRRPRRG